MVPELIDEKNVSTLKSRESPDIHLDDTGSEL